MSVVPVSIAQSVESPVPNATDLPATFIAEMAGGSARASTIRGEVAHTRQALQPETGLRATRHVQEFDIPCEQRRVGASKSEDAAVLLFWCDTRVIGETVQPKSKFGR